MAAERLPSWLEQHHSMLKRNLERSRTNAKEQKAQLDAAIEANSSPQLIASYQTDLERLANQEEDY